MDQFKTVSEQCWEDFLEWHGKYIGKYDWIPVTVVNRVNVFNRNRKLVAYKYQDECYIDNCEYSNMMKWVGVN